MIKIAVAKGRVAKQAVVLFEKCGIHFDAENINRKLIIEDDTSTYQMILVKPSDTAVYVEMGVTDCGIVGRDILIEDEPEVYCLFPLNIGKCALCVAGYPTTKLDKVENIKAATKFVRSARKYFDERGIACSIIKLNGSVELAPILHMSDVIVDIVETGSTLRENGLSVLEKITDISSCFIVNKAALKTKYQELKPFIDQLKAADQQEAEN